MDARFSPAGRPERMLAGDDRLCPESGRTCILTYGQFSSFFLYSNFAAAADPEYAAGDSATVPRYPVAPPPLLRSGPLSYFKVDGLWRRVRLLFQHAGT